MFSAVNSRDAAQAINGSMLFSMLNSSACIEDLGLSSLLKTTVDDFADNIDRVEVRDSVSDIEFALWRGLDLKASRRGMTISTCWQTTSDGMNLHRVSMGSVILLFLTARGTSNLAAHAHIPRYI